MIVHIPTQYTSCKTEEVNGNKTTRCEIIKKYAKLGDFLPMNKHTLRLLVRQYDRMFIQL